MLILGIDPGLSTGWALLRSGLLEAAGLGDPRQEDLTFDKVIIEQPVVYPHSKTNPNDLIKLAIMVGEYRQFFGADKTVLVTPARWKGQVPKNIMEARIRIKFPNAKQLLDKYSQSTRHNVSDAIGLAWYGSRTL